MARVMTDRENVWCPDIEGRDFFVEKAAQKAFTQMSTKKLPEHQSRGHQLARGERQKEYGTPTDSFTRIGRIWAALLDLPNDISPDKVAVMLAGMKLSRLAFNPTHGDSQDDVEGYVEALRLVLDARE